MRYFIIVSVILKICSLISPNQADSEILGCGGFVKSHVSIDFSKIEVKLYTKQGNVKDKAFCAPINGYYFVPVYDKGDYFLKINPPPGWSFKPSQVDIAIDGISDICSKGIDINFIFEGFGITGSVDSVTKGIGPTGVSIKLLVNGQVIGITTTEKGNFYFTPVYPGTYTVVASHSRWRFKSDKVQVNVATGNTEIPKNSLVIGGYDVNGAISFENKPLSKVNFILLNRSSHPVHFEDCDTHNIINYISSEKKLCHVVSRSDGTFSFPMLSPGKYCVVPYFEEDNVKYLMEPNEVNVSVVDDTVDIEPHFIVTKFNVKGHVFTNVDGKSVPGAIVILNNKRITETLNDGSFLLSGLSIGTYSLMIEAPGLKFEKETFKLGPNVMIKSEYYPTAIQVCGNVASDQSHEVKFKLIESKIKGVTNLYTTKTEQETGDFCQFLSPGKYSATVKVTDKEISKGIQFFPVEQVFSLIDHPHMGLFFSQLKATVVGKVKCIRAVDCENITIQLKMENNANKEVEDIKYNTALNENGNYEIPNVVPGTYIVTLKSNKFCWKDHQHVITLTSEKTIVPDFIQEGYIIVIEASHLTGLQYRLVKGLGDKYLTVQIQPGLNTLCVKTAGKYEFQPNSCHQYDQSSLSYDVDTATKSLMLSPIKHLVSVDIKAENIPGTMYVNIKIGEEVTVQGPLKPEKIVTENANYYTVEIFLKEGEIATVSPIAEYLWFEPQSYNLEGGDDCVDHGIQIFGKKGKIIEGYVLPALEDVEISVVRSDGETIVRMTDKKGYYKFPTLDASYNYEIKPVKESYSFNKPDNKGNFMAHKLAEIIVEVIDKKDGKPLQGALISLSGSESYRSNLQTDNNGIILFTSLNPSDYFLRPMMKEYNFDPPAQMIKVNDGATVKVKLRGSRVAYSAYGQVITLSGHPEEKALVTATGVGSCSMYSEEATTETDGQFRIRGLQPNCEYKIKVKERFDPVFKIDNALPPYTQVKIVNEDIYDIKLTVIHLMPNMDVMAYVSSSDPENYKNIRIKLCSENNPNSPIVNMKLDSSLYRTQKIHKPGVLIHLSSLPLDNKLYSIRLESISTQNSQSYEPVQTYFNANTSFKNFNLEYKPTVGHNDQTIGQKSVLILPFLIFCILLFYNINKITAFCSENVGRQVRRLLFNLDINNSNTYFQRYGNAQNDKSSIDDIDEIVQNINVPKIRKKIRKEK